MARPSFTDRIADAWDDAAAYARTEASLIADIDGKLYDLILREAGRCASNARLARSTAAHDLYAKPFGGYRADEAPDVVEARRRALRSGWEAST